MTVTSPINLVVEVLSRASPSSHGWSLGSGYLVGGALVLTAAHNVGPGELLVRVSGVMHTAQLLLYGDEYVADIALLEITDESITAPRCRYGVIDRTLPTLINCWAVGFPLFKDHSSKTKKKRLLAQVDGVIPTLENLGYQYQSLSLQVAVAPREVPELSKWQGMAGAVVFAENDVVVGVISKHYPREGENSLTVVPVTAIDDLADKDTWWQMLGISRSHLITLPSPEAKLREEGLHVWTEADLRHYHNLREEFVSLSQVFDHWLASEPQKSGQRLRVLWLQGEEGEHRHQALKACLAEVSRDRSTIYDAGMDSNLLARALRVLISSKSYPIPPLISVELSTDEHRPAWTDVRNVLVRAENHVADDHQVYPRLIVAGSGEQAQEAWQALQERMEIRITDTKGRDLERPHSFHGVHSMDSATYTTIAMLEQPQGIKNQETVGGKAREKSLQVFCCYAREDQPFLVELKKRLIPLERNGLISIHADINISPGEDWEQKISHYLNTAHIILLLISQDFIASEYCYSREMIRSLERHNKGEACVIPIILRPVNLKHMPFSKIQSLPTNAKPITKWTNRDDAFLNMANGIEEAIEKLLLQS